MRNKPIKFTLLLIFFLLTVGILSYSCFLPRYVEKNILPSLAEQLSTTLTGQVHTFSIHEAFISNIRVGEGPDLPLSIGSIQANYSLSTILDKKIKRLSINGLKVNLKIDAGKVVVPGIDLQNIAAADTKTNVPPNSAIIKLPVVVDTIQVNNGIINISSDGKQVFIPFDLQLNRTEGGNPKNNPVYKISLHIYPNGESIALTGIMDISNNIGKFNFTAESLDLNQFTFLLDGHKNKQNFGNAAIDGNINLKLKPFEIIETEINCSLESLSLKPFSVEFGKNKEKTETEVPIRFQVNGKGKDWNVVLFGSITEPVPASIVLRSSLEIENDKAIKGAGTFSVKSLDRTFKIGTTSKVASFNNKPEFQSSFLFKFNQSGTWQFEVQGSALNENLNISIGENSLSSKTLSFKGTGKGIKSDGRVDFSFSIADVFAAGPDSSKLIMPLIDLQGYFEQANKPSLENHRNGKIIISLPDVSFKNKTNSLSADVSLTGKMFQHLHDRGSLLVEGELAVHKATANELEREVRLDEITGKIPWQWPQKAEEKRGQLKIAGINWRNKELGSFKADIKLKSGLYHLDGSFNHTLPDGLMTKITGFAGIKESGRRVMSTLHMDISPFNAFHLGDFNPSLSGSFLSGDLGLDGKLAIDPSGLQGNMNVLLQNGKFEFPEKNLNIENIRLTLEMPSLPVLRSAPAQKFSFDRVTMGDLILDKGKATWQLESPDSIFIEEGAVKWVGGHVFANAVRISPGINDYVVPIFCDRLVLAEILNQFGISGAEGEGTVSGRIPLHLSKGSVRFEDGFLYSSPGKGGSIKVAVMELLSAGIPKNTPQFAQVDFASEALKNFQYDWVKLFLNSQEEDLLMQMQMNGKPVQSLPFMYDSRTGLLKRMDSTHKGINQPIRLDVNFRLPLNRILGYSGKIQDLMKSIQ